MNKHPNRIPTATALAIVHRFTCVPMSSIKKALAQWSDDPDLNDFGCIFWADKYADRLIRTEPRFAEYDFVDDGTETWKTTLAAAINDLGPWVNNPSPD